MALRAGKSLVEPASSGHVEGDMVATATDERSLGALARFLGARTEAHCRPLLVAHANMLIYALAFWLQQPVLPYLSKELGVDAAMFGLVQTVFSGAQLLGGPLLGRLCDLAGVRVALVVSQLAAAASYALLAAASSVPLLVLSRLPSFLMHAMMATQAAISALSSETDRARALGRVSLTYGLGMVAGSSLGGLAATHVGYSNVAWLAALLSLATVPMTLTQLAVAVPAARAAGASPAAVLSLAEVRRLLGIWQPSAQSAAAAASVRRLRSVLAFAFVMGSGLAMQQTTFSLVAIERLGLEASQLGLVMSAVAALGVLFNLVSVGPLVLRLGEQGTCVLAAALGSGAFVLYSQTTSLSGVLVSMVPMSLATSAMYTVITSAVSKAVAPADVGLAIGLRHGLASVLGVAAPSIAGFLLSRAGFTVLALTCAGTSAAAAVVAASSPAWEGVAADEPRPSRRS